MTDNFNFPGEVVTSQTKLGTSVNVVGKNVATKSSVRNFSSEFLVKGLDVLTNRKPLIYIYLL